MAQTQQAAQQAGAVYSLQGTLMEACSCNVLCPCWIGEDPDGGECYAVVAWHIDSGQVTGIDVSGRSLVAVTHIPGNVLAGNWELVLLVDERTSPEQRDALVKVFSGHLGGALADFAQLIGSPSATRSAAAPGPFPSPASLRPSWSPTAVHRATRRPCGTPCSRPCQARRPGCPRRPGTG
jgi:hypothetical protein